MSAFTDTLPQYPGGEFGSREVTEDFAQSAEGKEYRESGHMYFDPSEGTSVVGNIWILPPDGPPVNELNWDAVQARIDSLHAERDEKQERFNAR